MSNSDQILSRCPFCDKQFPSYEKRKQHQDLCFKKQEIKREKRNFEKQALAGAKVMIKINYPLTSWNDFVEETQQHYIKMAKACIKAADKVLLEI